MSKYFAAVAFAIAGVALGAVNVWNNAAAVNGGAIVMNDLTALVAGLAIVSAMLSLSLGAIGRKSKVTAALAVVVIAGCVFTSVGYTLARVGNVADEGASVALAHNASIKRAKDDVDRLSKAVVAERANGGCGKNCRDIKSDLAAAQAVLAGLGSRKVVDAAGERIEAVTGGWLTADRYRTAHPVVTAATLELGVSLLLTIAGLFAASGRKAPIVIDITPSKPGKPIGREEQVRLFVSDFQRRFGRVPTFTETAQSLPLPPSTVSKYRLRVLASK